MKAQAMFDLGLWLAGIAHFCVLFASLQVPARMNWRTDLAKLHPLNRKLMWTYGVFIALTIVGFGTLTLVLHDELLSGYRAALGLATFIGIFWLVRVVVDLTYLSHKVWPRGKYFLIGHYLLAILFSTLSVTYLGLVGWHLLKENK